MSTFQPSRVKTQFRNRISTISPVLGRKYTMTHSDETGELFVTIGTQYAEDMVDELRDEVRLVIKNGRYGVEFFGMVLISGDGITEGEEKRNEIFLREMPLALKAIRYADCKLFERWPKLDQIPIHIWFRSKNDKYNKIYDFGTMEKYKQ